MPTLSIKIQTTKESHYRSRNNLKISDKLSGSIDFSVRYATKNDPTSGSPIRAAYMYPSIYLGLYPDGRVGPVKTAVLAIRLPPYWKAERRRPYPTQ